MSEKYNYDNHPHLEEFKEYIRETGKRHPWLQAREERAAQILAEIETIPIPGCANDRLSIHPADQGLVITPYDDFENMKVAIPPEVYLEGWKVLWEYNLRLANHPARIAAMQELEQKGFQPPKKITTVIDDELLRRRILQLADLGHAVDIAIAFESMGKLTKISQAIEQLRNKDQQHIEENLSLVNEFLQNIKNWKQTHRTELLATGPFTLLGGYASPDVYALSFPGLGAMPDITGSVLMGETAAKMMVPFGIPEVGQFSDINRQQALAKAIMERLTPDDPILEGRSEEEKNYILKHWRVCPIGVVEVTLEKALRRAAALANVGITSIRVYGHTRGGDVVRTTEELRKRYPNFRIISGMVSGIDVALALEYVGADAIEIGVGAGGRCTTAELAQLIPTNAALPILMRGLLHIPVWGEGGFIDEPIVSLMAGVSQVNGSGSIGGGTFESPGGMYYLTDGRNFFKFYGGEASPRFKYLSGRTFATGLNFMVEGENGQKFLLPLEESMTQKVISHWSRVVLAAVVLGIDAGPFIVEAIQNFDPSPIFYKSRTASHIQAPH